MNDTRPTDAEAIDRLLAVIQLIRKSAPTMPIQRLEVYLRIARDGKVKQQSLVNATAMTESSVSRHIATLGTWGDRGVEPLKWIQNAVSQEERRGKDVVVTPKGKRIIEKITEILYPTST